MEVDDGRKKKDPGRVKMDKCEDDGQNTPYSGPEPAQPSLQQLQEELQSQQLTNEALQHENSKLKEQSAHDKNTIETYQRKLKEYHSALNQRDQLLGQMKSRMSESLQQQDKHRKDYQQKGDALTREVNVLKAQLKEMTDSMANNCSWLSGVSPSEYIQLKNKVIGIEENQRKDIEVIEKLTLRLKIMNQRNVELQAYQETSERLETDIMALKDTIERQKEELKEAEIMIEDERKTLKERNNLLEIQQQDLEETVKVLDVKLTEAETHVRESKEEMQLVKQREQEAKEKAATEVQDLMQQLQASNKALSESQRQASLEVKLVEDTEKLLGEVVKEKEEVMDNLKKAERKYEEAECLASSLKTIVENLNEDLRKVTAERVDIESQLSKELKKGEQLIAEKLALEERIKDNMETYSSTVMQTKGEKEELNIKLKDLEERHCQVLEELETKKKKLEEIEEARLSLAEEREKVEGETVKLLKKENEFLKHELSQCTGIFTAEIDKFKEEAESKIHLEKEMLILKSENKDLMEKCEVLACYEEQCNTLKTTLNEQNEQLEMLKAKQKEYEQLQKQMEEKERETETLRENYVTLINQCSEAEAQRKQLKEEYEEKCHRLNEGYKRLDAMIADAVSISSQSSEVTDLNLTLEKNLKMVIGKLRQSEENMLHLEEGLQKLTLEKEDLLKQLSEGKKMPEMVRLKEKWEHERNELVKEKEAVMNKLSQVTTEGSIISQQLEAVEKERDRMLGKNKKLLEERDRLGSEKMEIFKERKRLVGEQEEMQKELCDTRMMRDMIEQQKNECEVEKDKLLEEYRRKETQLAEALLALDRQAQLPNPQHFTSQSGISVSTSTSLDSAILQHNTESKHNVDQQPNIVKAVIVASANPSNDAVITITKKCDGVRETIADAEIEIDTKDSIGQRINDTEEHLARLDKENKELKNELQKLTTKTHDQRFTITSLENERSRLKRRVVDLESEKMALRADQERLIQEKTEKMELQRLLNDLKVKMDQMEDTMKLLEKDSSRLHQALRGILQGEKSVQDPDVQEVMKSIKPRTLKRDSSGSCDFQKECQTSKSEELHCLSEEFHSLSEELLQTKREVDQLHTEKLGVELENINLTAQLEKLKSGNYSTVDMSSGDVGRELVCEIIDSRLSNSGIGITEICDEEIKSYSNEADERTSTDSPSSVNTREYLNSRKLQTKDDHGDSSTVTSTIKPKSEWSQEEDVRKLKTENKRLRNLLEKEGKAMTLEKLHLRSSKLRKSSVGDLDQELLTVGVRAALEQLVAEWESQQFTSFQEFIDVQAARVRVVAEQLGGHGTQVWDSLTYVKAAMRLLHQAIIKVSTELFLLSFLV
ncbi:hypothetical protein Pcinc_024841 [Petrolisthes cinctipes]|uniref:Uncharacterized protein n=1 Tax=Petrolisthes cinctipes TaxID=88211 RepID=A0AAE1F9Q5_PETCI|nr:hypothetical protein Pcinc_024841 [Petrolisthes cinctipes]